MDAVWDMDWKCRWKRDPKDPGRTLGHELYLVLHLTGPEEQAKAARYQNSWLRLRVRTPPSSFWSRICRLSCRLTRRRSLHFSCPGVGRVLHIQTGHRPSCFQEVGQEVSQATIEDGVTASGKPLGYTIWQPHMVYGGWLNRWLTNVSTYGEAFNPWVLLAELSTRHPDDQRGVQIVTTRPRIPSRATAS